MLQADGRHLLMVDPVHDHAQPVMRAALRVMTAPRAQVMARCVTALFLTEAGEVLHMTSAQPVTPGFFAALRLRLGQEVPARYSFERIEMPLEDLRVMLLDCATYMRNRPDAPAWWLVRAPIEEVRQTLDAADSLADLHARLPLSQDHPAWDLP